MNIINIENSPLCLTLYKWMGGLCLVLFPLIFYAQSEQPISNPSAELLKLLSENILEGDKIAFRDLAKLYDKQPKNQDIIAILARHTLFTKTEWDWNSSSKTTSFLDFFYQKEKNLRFAELLRVFYLTPIEERKVTADIQIKHPSQSDPFLIKRTVKNIGLYLHKKQVNHLLHEIDQIGSLNKRVISTILVDLIKKKGLQKLNKEQKLVVFAKILNYLPDDLAFEQLLILTKKEVLPFGFCQQNLAIFSNNFFTASNHQELVNNYEKLRSWLGDDLSVIKEYGYQKVALTPLQFFKEKVDYFGWMLAINNDSLFWIQRNALIDMINTHHSRALFYTVGWQFRNWKAGEANDNHYLKLVQNNIDVHIKVKGKNGWVEYPKSAEAELNYLSYWASHYEEYEWDNLKEKFINKRLIFNELKNYNRCFRRLNSTNDSIARAAFEALSKGKPNEIEKLLKKYKPLLRNYNVSLPPLKYQILEQTSLLTYFCQQNNYNFLPNNSLKQSLEKLSKVIPPKERFGLENQLIHTLIIDDLTTIEYYAALHAENLDLNYSIGRVLDYLYAQNWAEIISSERNFRLYLLKVQLFRDFGGFGSCKKYAQKIDCTNPTVTNLLHNLNKLETNPYIQQSIRELLAQKKLSCPTDQLAQFLAAPKNIKLEDLKKLPPFSLNSLPKIVQTLFQQQDKKAVKNIGKYLELYASTDMIPPFFEMPQKQWTANKNAGKVLVKILETVYQFSFSNQQQESILKWWDLWRTNSVSYPNWRQLLFQQQLDKIKYHKVLTINDINKVSNSFFYNKKYRKICLERLKKIKNLSAIYQLKMSPKISIKEELFYFQNIDFNYKELGKIAKIFDIDSPKKLLEFIAQKTKNIDLEKKSYLYNKLFRQQWFIEHITKGKIAPERAKKIKSILTQYLSKSTFLTEYEEYNTQINILHLAYTNYSLKEKLIQITKDSLNENIRYHYLQSILSRIEFYEIIIAFPILKDLNIGNKNVFAFLNKDFGLPIFDFLSKKEEEKNI